MKRELVHIPDSNTPLLTLIKEMKDEAIREGMTGILEVELDDASLKQLYREMRGPTPVIGSRAPWVCMQLGISVVKPENFVQRLIRRFR